MKVERRDNGDVILLASNGDLLVKFQAAEAHIVVGPASHPLDVRSGGALPPEALQAIREFCERAEAV